MKPEEIVALFANRAEAFARHDTVQLAATHAEDGVLLSPTGGTIIGREAIEKVCAYLGDRPAQIIKRVNSALVRRAIESRFVTGMYAILSCDGTLTYCNAGHNPPLLVGKRGIRRLERGGLILGAFDDAAFEEETLQLDRGDTLVVFSDGISEALNSDGEEFGEQRLLACLECHRELQPTVLLDCILDTVHEFTRDAVQNDDLSVLVLRYLGASEVSSANFLADH